MFQEKEVSRDNGSPIDGENTAQTNRGCGKRKHHRMYRMWGKNKNNIAPCRRTRIPKELDCVIGYSTPRVVSITPSTDFDLPVTVINCGTAPWPTSTYLELVVLKTINSNPEVAATDLVIPKNHPIGTLLPGQRSTFNLSCISSPAPATFFGLFCVRSEERRFGHPIVLHFHVLVGAGKLVDEAERSQPQIVPDSDTHGETLPDHSVAMITGDEKRKWKRNIIPDIPDEWAAHLPTLAEMGYHHHRRNRRLLVKFRGDLNSVISRLDKRREKRQDGINHWRPRRRRTCECHRNI